MQATDLSDMRLLSRECANIRSVHVYVANTARRIYETLKFLGLTDAEIIARLHKDDMTSAGQVVASDVMKLLGNDANIRELNTLIMNFSANNCDIIWKLMIRAGRNQALPVHVNKSALLKRMQSIEQATGVAFDTLVSICASDEGESCKLRDRLVFHKNGFPLECHLATKSRDGPVSLARTIQPAFRLPRNKNGLRSKRIAEADVYPPLSAREKSFTELGKDGYLPWTTGLMYWDIRPDKRTNEYNMFTYMAKKFDHEIVCGPSGNTDLQLGTFELFNKRTKTSLNKGGVVLYCMDVQPTRPQSL